MSRPRTLQETVHWLEMGAGARWVRLAAVLVGGLALSLVVAWKQFRGPTSELTLAQADLGRQIATGAGFTTLVNYPQASAVLESRGMEFSPARPFPELYHAPLYPLAIAAGLKVLPSGFRESLFAQAPVDRDGFGADYYLLGLNLLLFWLAIWLTFDLATRLFSPRVGWLAALGLLLSVTAWRHVVAVDGVALAMVIALLAFRTWCRVEQRIESGAPASAGLALLGLCCGLLGLVDYAAGVLVVVALGWIVVRIPGRARGAAAALVLGGFLLPLAPWMIRNARLTGHPMALAAQNVALKSGDITAEPQILRARLSTERPSVDLRKLGNKALTNLQENVKSHLWSGGGLFLTAFFVAGWLYAFRSPVANRQRWTFTAALVTLVASQAFLNSGESERLPVLWLAPLIMVFGAGFFFVLLDANSRLAPWPRLAAGVLLAAQALPLAREALGPRGIHFSYPPYYPRLLLGLREEMERRGALGRYGAMADIPAGAAWYGRQRVWAQPGSLRDFHVIMIKQPIGELLLTPRTLDRPFLSELGARQSGLGSLRGAGIERFGEWGQIYGSLLTGQPPASFPLTVRRQVAENLYVLFNPTLPDIRGN